MSSKGSTVIEAYKVLGLEEGASLDVVKNTYKQLALKTHPDKNPDSQDATAQFQRLSEAYNVLQKHLLQSASFPHNQGYSDSHSSHSYEFEYDSIDEDDEDYNDEYYGDSDEYYECDDSDRLFYYLWLYEQMMKDRRTRASYTQFQRRRREFPKPETNEEHAARIRRAREEQEEAEARRVRDQATRKLALEQERAQERGKAEARRRIKAEQKRVQAEASRQDAEKKKHAQDARLQSLRSEIFAAARAGDNSRVKKGVWEEGVSSTGGEVRKGAESFAKDAPVDPLESLMHIAANHGNTELVQWLDAHSADPEERDSADFTAFHNALKGGHTAIMRHFYISYPPQDPDYSKVYASPAGVSVLLLAIGTLQPELVQMVLDEKLASQEEIDHAWTYLNSTEGTEAILGNSGDEGQGSKFGDIQNLLMTFGCLTPPPTPKHLPQGKVQQRQVASSAKDASTPDPKYSGRKRPTRPRTTRPRNAPSSLELNHSNKEIENPSPALRTSDLPNEASRGSTRHQHGRHPIRLFPLSPVSIPDQSPLDGNTNPMTVSSRPLFPNGRPRGRGTWSHGRGRGRSHTPSIPTA